jgi:hydrogenase maturation protein HypF
VTTCERRRFLVRGIVQGVGFRPFVHSLATRHGLSGFVLNDGSGVVIEAEGDPDALDVFAAAVAAERPPLAHVQRVVVETIPTQGTGAFSIELSERGEIATVVPADAATCAECLAELNDPDDRRYRYPFVNCTRCGPRFTIVRAVPYDRSTTTMAVFPMCADCRREYEDPGDRRFHAEATCCPVCGPRLSMPLEKAVTLLQAGAILAVKGIGGYHLACDARNEEAVDRLRRRKARDDKPFAVLTSAPTRLAALSTEELDLLRGPSAPIVIARRRDDAPVAPSVAPGTRWLGLLLPYSPLHHLLADDFGGPLVLTSGNRSDEPIAIDDGEARSRLGSIADAFLTHDRAIHRRCEDSVVRADGVLRRSRGHVPVPIGLGIAAVTPVVAVGGELKATFCVARGTDAYLSPHLGDLTSEQAYAAFSADLELYLSMIGIDRAQVVAHDLHPEYLSTKWAFEQDARLVGVQHHHAHAAACLAEHAHWEPALALVFDGTGYGTDGSLWGGELLRCDLESFERLAHLDPVPLPGGEAAIRQPWRMAAIHLETAGRPVPFPDWPRVREALKLGGPQSSGMGRLFDAVAAILGVRHEVSYEGQAAIELEHLAGDVAARPYPWRFGSGAELVAAVHDDLQAGRDRAEIAASFHETVAHGAVEACLAAGEPRTVVLSGGTFQNRRLAQSVVDRLAANGFQALRHRRVPANDGGLSFGQAAVAARRIAPCV